MHTSRYWRKWNWWRNGIHGFRTKWWVSCPLGCRTERCWNQLVEVKRGFGPCKECQIWRCDQSLEGRWQEVRLNWWCCRSALKSFRFWDRKERFLKRFEMIQMKPLWDFTCMFLSRWSSFGVYRLGALAFQILCTYSRLRTVASSFKRFLNLWRWHLYQLSQEWCLLIENCCFYQHKWPNQKLLERCL